MDHHDHSLVITRPSRVVGVQISAPIEGGDHQLPTVSVTICISAAGGLGHEHVLTELDSTTLDAIEKARSELPGLVLEHRA